MDHDTPVNRDDGAPARAVAPLGISPELAVDHTMGHQTRHSMGLRDRKCVGNLFN
jgi:hypothetical protein